MKDCCKENSIKTYNRTTDEPGTICIICGEFKPDFINCSGCGWTGKIEELNDGNCPNCNFPV